MNEALIKEFLLESFENLSNISDELTTFEKDPNNKELVNSIFRKVHTLKGSASFLGFQKLQMITHSAESLLDLLREGTYQINAEFIDVLLESFDLCIQILKSVEVNSTEPSTDYSDIVKKLQSCIKNGSSSDKVNLLQENDLSVSRGSKINSKIFNNPEPIQAKSTLVQEKIIIQKETIKELKVVVKEAPEAKMETKNTDTKPNSSETENSEAANKNSTVSDSVVRVNVQLLDKIMNVVGELVLNRNQILQYANQMDAPELNRLSQQLNIITSELQTDIMTTRMQPVGSVLSKFERIVRDLARSNNKKIKLEIIGKETELDKTLLEAIRDPLTHLIRNSVDHGVELPEVRKNKGKNEEGKITIRSFHEGGQVSIEIKDDGNGIDSEKVLSKAIQKGIVTAEQGKLMSTKQIQNIIFMAGFSTADQVTNISGRGVGMDVVRSNIENIGGTVDINSEFGQGTTFKLKIPLTLAIVPALVVQDRNETFALPQISLVELVRLDSTNENGKIEKLYDSEFLRLRGELIPVYRLADVLKLKNKSDSATTTYIENDSETVNIVVLNAEGKTYGLIVEQIQDTEEIVVKPLSPELKKLNFFAGATIMGDGRVALILDALGFYNFADKGHGNKIEKMNQELNAVSDTTNADSQELLICELGDQRNYAFPLVLVNRLEEFKSTQIEWTGDQPIVKYGSFPMPLINVEAYLKLKGNSILDKCHSREEVLVPCIVVKIRNHLFGFVVNEIKDISVTDSSIFSDSIDRQGLLGTVFINDKSITILDIHTILEQLNIGKNLFGNKAIKKKGRILMVEDSPLYRKIQSDFLEDQGYDVVLAVNGHEALEILNNDQKFNLIISDIEMPVMDGWTFTETLRKSGGNFSNIPILAVSSRVSPKDKEKSQTSGFNEHIEKLNKDEIIKTIQNYI